MSKGTGKTVVYKALMAEAEEITCITTNAYSLDADEYVTELYELAHRKALKNLLNLVIHHLFLYNIYLLRKLCRIVTPWGSYPVAVP